MPPGPSTAEAEGMLGALIRESLGEVPVRLTKGTDQRRQANGGRQR
jgi:hypothetical protein